MVGINSRVSRLSIASVPRGKPRKKVKPRLFPSFWGGVGGHANRVQSGAGRWMPSTIAGVAKLTPGIPRLELATSEKIDNSAPLVDEQGLGTTAGASLVARANCWGFTEAIIVRPARN